MEKMEKIEKMKEKAYKEWEKMENLEEGYDLRDLSIAELNDTLSELNSEYYQRICQDDPEVEDLPKNLQKILEEVECIVVPYEEFEDTINAKNIRELKEEYIDRIIDEIIIYKDQCDDKEQYLIFKSIFGSEEIYRDFSQEDDIIDWTEITIERIYNINEYYLVVWNAYGIVETESLEI